MLAHIIRIALSQRLMALVIATLVVAGGLWAFAEIPIDAFPELANTQVQVIVKAPGMGPQEVEQRITQPIETEARGIPHQTMLRSITKYALAVVTIDFADGTDVYWARQQVNERIAQVLGRLPPGVEGGLAPITSPLSEVFMFMVEGPGYTNRDLRSILDWMIRPRLRSVDGVADVNSLGGEVRSFRVEPHPAALRSHGLTIADLSRAIRENNHNAGGDRLVRNQEVLLVRTLGQLTGVRDIAHVTVAARKGVPVRVRDVARVSEEAMIRYGGVTRDGKGEAVQGLVLLRTGANGRKTIEATKAKLVEIQKSLPKGVRITPVYDRSALVTRAVNTVQMALVQAVALVLVVLLVFLGNVRSAITAGLILPLTVLGAFLPMRVLGISANLMSLGGLAIAIGVLVDSAVVVVENVHSHLGQARSGGSRLHTVYRAATEVARPVVAGVLIIVVSFVPIFTLTGIEGKLFTPLAITISIALIISLILSLTVIPVLASLVMRKTKTGPSRVLRALLSAYRPTVTWALGHRLVALGIASALLLATIAVFPFIGREFLPTLDEGTVVVQTEKLPSISLKRSLEIDVQMQKAIVDRVDEVVGVVSRTGSDELRLDPMGLHQTDSFLVTKPRDQWSVETVEALHAKIRKVLDDFPGVSYGFTQPIDMRVSEMLTGVRAAMAVKLFGDDMAVLEKKSHEIERLLRRIPGAVDVVRTPLRGQTYLQIKLLPDRMSPDGVSAADINGLVASAVGGEVVTEVVRGNRRVPVVLRLPAAQRSTRTALEELRVRTASGQQRMVRDYADLSEVDGPVQITRELGKRMVVIQANVKGRDIVGFVGEVRRTIARDVKLPPGFYVTFGGQFENQQRASRRLLLAVPVALVAIGLLLFTTFGSVRHAAIILANIPFAMIGGVTLLFAAGAYLSVPASVGFIALFGMAVMNGVVMVNTFNQLRRTGLTVDQAVRQGAERRLRPVLMTAILTVLGLVPLLVATGPGSEIQRPLAIVVVGGTFSATLLTLVLLPTLYAWIEGYAERRTSPFASPPKAVTSDPTPDPDPDPTSDPTSDPDPPSDPTSDPDPPFPTPEGAPS